MTGRADEIEAFKTDIDLVAFAEDHGYVIDPRKTCRTSVAMKHDTFGDRILVAIGSNGHHIYASVHDPSDQGSIVDFCQKRGGGNLGEVRKALRPYVNGHNRPSRSWASAKRAAPNFKRMRSVRVDLAEVRRLFDPAQPIEAEHGYLTNTRAIPAAVYLHPRFARRLRVDGRGNVLFPHFGSKGEITGFEAKNQDFTGFAKGGVKRLFCSGFGADDTHLVIAESGIDALSYAALFGVERRRFLSTAGALNPEQLALLRSAMQKLPESGTVILAVDADEGGDALAEAIGTVFLGLGRDEVAFERHSPPTRGMDWNDALRSHNAGASLPSPESP